MNKKILGLGIALGYPEQAFEDMPDSVIEQAEALVRRADSGEPMADEITEFFRSQPALNEWVEQLLEDPHLRPPHLRPREVRSYERLTGEPHVSAPRYACVNNHPWYQAFVSDDIPDCKVCGEKLFTDPK
jgi:hypothetical protein